MHIQTWLRFFFGSPQRFLWTLIGILVIASVVNPQIPVIIVDRILTAIQPVIGPALAIAIVMGGLKIMTSKR